MSDVKIHNFQLADTILRDDSPHSKYKETGTLTKNIHDGQMKMLLPDDMVITNGLLYICSQSQYKTNMTNIKHRGTKFSASRRSTNGGTLVCHQTGQNEC